MNNIGCGLVLLSLFGPAIGWSAGTADALFEQGIVKESGERDLDAALELFRQTVEKAGSDYRLIAKARLHIGSCLERLGKPQDAQAVYQQILTDSAVAPVEDVQTAQANLDRLLAQERKARDDAEKSTPMVLVKEFHDTAFSGWVGSSVLRSGSHTGGAVSLAGRYRLSRPERPLALFGEVGLFLPFEPTMADSAKTWNLTTTDSASLKLRYQLHVALIAELPHKTPRTIPEVGIGAALTSSRITYQSATSAGETADKHWSPYLAGGIRFFADKRASLRLGVSYTANPYSHNIQISSPNHKQTFDFPNGIWAAGAQVQIKIGWTKSAIRKK